MKGEDEHWRLQIEDFQNNPNNGIRGKGMKRRPEYVQQDQNLRLIFESRADRQPLDYLRAISYRLPNPI
jgi:hypothetical protein